MSTTSENAEQEAKKQNKNRLRHFPELRRRNEWTEWLDEAIDILIERIAKNPQGTSSTASEDASVGHFLIEYRQLIASGQKIPPAYTPAQLKASQFEVDA